MYGIFSSEDLTPLFPEESSIAWLLHMAKENDYTYGLDDNTCRLRDPRAQATVCIRPRGHTGPHVNYYIVWLDGYTEALW